MTTSMAVIPAAAGDGIEAAIRREHAAATAAAGAALGHALECGRLLAQARPGIGHGSWESFVRDTCGIAPRTARLYLRLDANRDRLANRQHVAGLTVREAVRELTVPRERPMPAAGDAVFTRNDQLPKRVNTATAAEDAEAVSLFGPVPSWYRPGVECNGYHHPTKWFFQLWPHPAGEPWVHLIVWVPSGTGSWSHGEGPKRGIHVGALGRYLRDSIFHGMPPMDDEGWGFWHEPVNAMTSASSKTYNAIVFDSEEHYRVHGLGLQPAKKPRRKPRQGAPA
jgi:hypothetical protein